MDGDVTKTANEGGRARFCEGLGLGFKGLGVQGFFWDSYRGVTRISYLFFLFV